MASIYENQKTRLPSVWVTAWQAHKLRSWLDTYGMTYKQLITEIIYEIRVAFETGTPNLANPHRDIREAVGRVIDNATDRNALQGRVRPQYPHRSCDPQYHSGPSK